MSTVVMEILLVEDNPGDADLVRDQLEDAPYTTCRVSHVDRLSEALRLLQSSRFDVVLLDLSLPDSSGLDTVRGFHAASMDAPIVVLSGLDDEELAVQAVREGAQDYLVKSHTDGYILIRALRYAIERKRAEATRAQLAAIVESSTDAIISTTLQGRIVSWNTGAQQMYGYTFQEMHGRPLVLLTPSAHADAMPGPLDRLQRREAPVPYEVVHVRKDGHHIDVLLTISPLRDVTDQMVGASVIARDITEHKRAEEAMRRQRDWLDVTLSSIGDAVIATDTHGVITFMNPVAAALTGWSAGEALGHHVDAVLRLRHEPTQPDVTSPVSWVLREGTISHLAEHTVLLRRDGHETPITDNAAPIRSSLGTLQGVVVVFHDISERRHLEEQLRQAQKMEAIGTLAGGIAHDFNNILGAILGYTELAADDLPPGSAAWPSLQNVLKAGNRAKDLVQQILAFSRRTRAERLPLQLHRIIHEALPLLRASLPSTIEIQQHIDPNAGLVLADATQMHQIVMNLCTNAAYALRQTGGLLTVCVEAVEVDAARAAEYPNLHVGPYVRLIVQDTGHGMPAEVVARIYEPFFTTKEVGEGTGIGLSVVHGIVVDHGGVITVESQPGQGTTFAIYLPRIAHGVGADTSVEAHTRPGHECILLVDDEEMLVRLGQELLTRLGYEVVVCTSGQAALMLFQTSPHRFDLVVTDYTMPRMTGEVLARALRRIRPDIPIILGTGFSHTMDAEKARTLGIDGFLLKPWTGQELTQAIQQVLERRRELVEQLEAPNGQQFPGARLPLTTGD